MNGSSRTGHRVLAGLALVTLLFAVGVAVAAGLRSSGAGDVAAETSETAATAPAGTVSSGQSPAAPVPVRLRAVRAFDPEGDGSENDERAPLATDGDPATFWATERYRSFFKDGVGLVLDAGEPVTLVRVVVTTDTPGFRAGVKVGPTPEGPFVAVAPAVAVGGRTTLKLRPRNGRYAMLWIEQIPPASAAHVSEVRAWRAGGAP